MDNVWHRFQGLLPKTPLMVGTVASHGANNTSTITLLGGTNVLVVQGQSVAVGQKAFVKDGRVQGSAPNLTTYNVTV